IALAVVLKRAFAPAEFRADTGLRNGGWIRLAWKDRARPVAAQLARPQPALSGRSRPARLACQLPSPSDQAPPRAPAAAVSCVSSSVLPPKGTRVHTGPARLRVPAGAAYSSLV